MSVSKCKYQAHMSTRLRAPLSALYIAVKVSSMSTSIVTVPRVGGRPLAVAGGTAATGTVAGSVAGVSSLPLTCSRRLRLRRQNQVDGDVERGRRRVFVPTADDVALGPAGDV